MPQSGSYDQIQEVYDSKDNVGYYCRRTPGECAYRFVEYNPGDRQKAYPLLTNRVITASASQCSTWETEAVVKSPHPCVEEFHISNGSHKDKITIPRQLQGLNGTTYIYRGFHPPPNATIFACGDRCIWMWAHKFVGAQGEHSTFYRCAVNISHVTNTNHSTQDVSRDVARLAAAAIALQGRPAQDPWMQYQFFPFG